ncbi:hypothetical protein MIND_00911800 [Mycena indigotica]|uniref:Uncharacterized protein n=1 Tax=Mycena indigotica TaxID=2126181 RepID=A0A8H6W085_9AGAR|nr:uncharacterized protein MIND_00911800 [Mycena indigotica]KAF7296808.1 hypothetical protein MIND_00911800 [Mycena indigotica]
MNATSTSSNCDDIHSCRTLSSVIWSCLATIFACVWLCVHPNVPPRALQHSLGLRTSFWRKAQQNALPLWHRFKLMLIALLAPELIAGLAGRQLAVARSLAKEFDVSLTHGFFIGMGGFVTPDGHPIVTRAQISDEGVLDAIRAVPEEDIQDKSNGDVFSKGAALLQGLWFIAQGIARAIQHLPLAELEIATLAFAVISSFIWALWWRKPLDVGAPIIVGKPYPVAAAPLARITRHNFWLFTVFNVVGGQAHTRLEFDPRMARAVPTTYYASAVDAAHIGGLDVTFFAELLGGAVFGAIYCLAWNSFFPSIAEMWLWRAAAALVAAIPLLGIAIFALGLSNMGHWFLLIGGVVYVLARIALIVLPLTTLRAQPPGLLVDVDWSGFFPHLA